MQSYSALNTKSYGVSLNHRSKVQINDFEIDHMISFHFNSLHSVMLMRIELCIAIADYLKNSIVDLLKFTLTISNFS